VFRTNLANDVMPTVIPGDPGLTVHHRPGSMIGAKSFVRLAISFESNIKISSPGTLAHSPSAYKMVPPGRKRRGSRGIKFEALGLRHAKTLLPSVPEDHNVCVLELDLTDFSHGNRLPTTILHYHYQRPVCVSRRGLP